MKPVNGCSTFQRFCWMLLITCSNCRKWVVRELKDRMMMSADYFAQSSLPPPHHPPKKENKVKRGLWSDFLIMLLVPKWRTRAGLCLNLPEGENKEFGERSQRKNIRLKFPGAWQESLSSCGRTVQLMLTFDLLSVIEQKPQTKFLLEWIDVFL